MPTVNAMISWIDMLIVAAFLVATLYMGLRLKKRQQNSSNYILGGRALTLPAFIATTVSTWYGGILGVGEYAWSYGISNWLVFGVPYYVGALLFALFLSRRARASESLTIPHRFEKFYGQSVSRCSAVLIFLTTVPGAYILIMGTLCSLSFSLPIEAGILVTAIFVVTYLWRGGFKAVVKTDAIQCALMFGGFILLSCWLLIGYGLEPLSNLPETHLDPTGGQPLGSILIWYVIALSTLAEPNFFQRAFAAKTPTIARRGLLISIGCWVVFDMMTTLCGLYARALLPNLDKPLHAFPALATEVLPIGLAGIFFAGMFATVLSTLDSNLFTCATTFGRDLWRRKNEQNDARNTTTDAAETLENDTHSLNMPDQNSTNSSSDKDNIETHRIRIGLILSAVLASIIAISAGSVISIWKIFGSISAVSLLLPILGTYYNPVRMTPQGTLALMLLSSATTLLWYVYSWLGNEYPFGIAPLFAGGIVSILCWCFDLFFRKGIFSSKMLKK